MFAEMSRRTNVPPLDAMRQSGNDIPANSVTLTKWRSAQAIASNR
jgi:hypothetical protein